MSMFPETKKEFHKLKITILSTRAIWLSLRVEEAILRERKFLFRLEKKNLMSEVNEEIRLVRLKSRNGRV